MAQRPKLEFSSINKNISYISQDENGQKGNYYKFIIYDYEQPIAVAFPKLKTVTSRVYDYCLCKCNNLINNHVCLPIWYNLELDIVKKVVSELS